MGEKKVISIYVLTEKNNITTAYVLDCKKVKVHFPFKRKKKGKNKLPKV